MNWRRRELPRKTGGEHVVCTLPVTVGKVEIMYYYQHRNSKSLIASARKLFFPDFPCLERLDLEHYSAAALIHNARPSPYRPKFLYLGRFQDKNSKEYQAHVEKFQEKMERRRQYFRKYHAEKMQDPAYREKKRQYRREQREKMKRRREVEGCG